MKSKPLPTLCEECARLGWPTKGPLHGIDGKTLCWPHANLHNASPPARRFGIEGEIPTIRGILEKMQPNQPPIIWPRDSKSAYRAAAQLGIRIKTRKVNGQGFKIWRLSDAEPIAPMNEKETREKLQLIENQLAALHAAITDLRENLWRNRRNADSAKTRAELLHNERTNLAEVRQ